MSDEERLQALVAELRVLESYYNEVDARETVLARAILENRAALEAVKSLPQTSLSEILVPIGGSVFIHAQAPPPDSLIVNVGADVAVEKTRDGTVTFLEERIQEMEKAVTTLETQKGDLGSKINSIRLEINSLLEKSRPG